MEHFLLILFYGGATKLRYYIKQHKKSHFFLTKNIDVPGVDKMSAGGVCNFIHSPVAYATYSCSFVPDFVANLTKALTAKMNKRYQP
jgi:hypothetical protein